MAFKQNPGVGDTTRVGNNIYVWNGKAWKVEAGGLTGSITTTNRYDFTATEGQDTFTFDYNPGYIDIFLNGVHLNSSDFTATNGTSVVLNEACSVNDEFYALVFGKFVVADHYDKTETDTIINNTINNLIDSAPDQLNTLNELSAALNDDTNFATTVTDSINTKANATDVYDKATTDQKLADIEALVYGLAGGSGSN